MELWEFNLCVGEFNAMQNDSIKLGTAQAWRTANFTGAAVHGCLRDLSEYIGENTKTAPKIIIKIYKLILSLVDNLSILGIFILSP